MATALTAVLLQSCKKEEEGYVGDYPDKAKVIFYNAAPNASTNPVEARREIAIYPIYNGVNYNNFPIKYPWSNGYKVFEPGTLTLRLDTAGSQANNPPGPAATVGTYAIPIQADSYYTVFAVNVASAVDTMVLKDDMTLPTKGKTRIRFFNLSADAGPIDIINTKTGAVLAGNISFKQRTAAIEVDPDDKFNMAIRAAGTTTNLVTKIDMVISANSVYTVWATGFRTIPSPGNTFGGYALQLNYAANRWTDPNRPLPSK